MKYSNLIANDELFAKLIRHALIEEGLQQKLLARELGMSPAVFSMCICGDRKFSDETKKRIATRLNLQDMVERMSKPRSQDKLLTELIRVCVSQRAELDATQNKLEIIQGVLS